MKLIAKNYKVRKNIIIFAIDYNENKILKFLFSKFVNYEEFSKRKYL